MTPIKRGTAQKLGLRKPEPLRRIQAALGARHLDGRHRGRVGGQPQPEGAARVVEGGLARLQGDLD